MRLVLPQLDGPQIIYRMLEGKRGPCRSCEIEPFHTKTL
jgi:hypothetical protein